MTRASSPHRKRSASVGAKRTTTTASEQNGNGTSPNGGGSSSNDWRLQPMHSSKPIELVWNAWRLAFIYLVWLASRAIFRAVSGASFMTLTLWVPLVLHLVCYWVVSGFFAWVDFAKTPEAVHQWKIQRRTHVDAWQYASGAAVVLINQFCFSLPLAIGTAWLMERNGVDIEVESMPDLFTSFKHLLCYAAIWEVMFYSSHRLLHYGPFYKYVHKRHHTFSATVSLAAEYAHPIEFVFGNSIPLTLGPLLMGSHLQLLYFWLMFGILDTCFGHCGYGLPWSPFGDSRVHDYHHFAFTSDFGSLGILDWLFGTEGNYTERDMKRA